MIFEITQIWGETLKSVVLPFIIEMLLKYTHTHNSKKLGSEQTRHNGVRVNDVILVQVIDSCFWVINMFYLYIFRTFPTENFQIFRKVV